MSTALYDKIIGGMSINNKRIGGLARGNQLLFKEEWLTNIGTSITANCKKDYAKIDSWVCASTQGANPSPTAPQTIYSSGDGGKIPIWSHKKNMWDKNSAVAGYIKADGTIGSSSNTKVTDFLNISNFTNLYRTSLANSAWYDINKAFISRPYSRSLARPTNAVYLKIEVLNTNLDTEQLEEGSSATSYEPYEGSITDITTPLNYIGGSLPNGVADTDTQKKIGKVVLNGSEGKTWDIVNGTGYLLLAANFIGVKTNPDLNVKTAMSDKFQPITRTEANAINKIGVVSRSTGGLVFVIPTSYGVTTSAQFNTWLASNNVTVYYELATPVDITITKPLIPTYEGNNTITTTNAVKPTLTVKTLKR